MTFRSLGKHRDIIGGPTYRRVVAAVMHSGRRIAAKKAFARIAKTRSEVMRSLWKKRKGQKCAEQLVLTLEPD